MKYNVHLTTNAENDLISAADYIEFTLLNPQAANDLIDQAEKEFKKLSNMPKSHQLVDDSILKSWEIRFILINNYIAFFRIDEASKTVDILRFLHGKRNWTEILKDESDEHLHS